jgi:hypothetical protein
MPVTFEVRQPLVLSKEEMLAIFESLYRGDVKKSKFRIVIGKLPGRTWGLHEFDVFADHKITLDVDKMKASYESGTRIMGGNLPKPNLKMCVASVLAHETQHANQSLTHSHREHFYQKRTYRSRACEVEARQFSDSSRPVLEGVLNQRSLEVAQPQANRDHGAVVRKVSESFKGTRKVLVDDIVDALRIFGANNPANLDATIENLRRAGVEVS